jgi:hypothetical protein
MLDMANKDATGVLMDLWTAGSRAENMLSMGTLLREGANVS